MNPTMIAGPEMEKFEADIAYGRADVERLRELRALEVRQEPFYVLFRTTREELVPEYDDEGKIKLDAKSRPIKHKVTKTSRVLEGRHMVADAAANWLTRVGERDNFELVEHNVPEEAIQS